jgi:hypothetical protein
MTSLRYDEPLMIGLLARLPQDLRVAFATACAERLLSSYVAYSAKTGREIPRRSAPLSRGCGMTSVGSGCQTMKCKSVSTPAWLSSPPRMTPRGCKSRLPQRMPERLLHTP